MTPASSRLLLSCPVLLVLSLSACELKGRTPHVELDKFFQATKIKEPDKPVRVIPMPEPLPLPGQLKKLPDRKQAGAAADLKQPVQKSASAADQIRQANSLARVEPVKDGFINAIQVYPFTQGALYQLYAAVNQVTDIGLQPGERLLSVSAGDTVRWIVGDSRSGTGRTEQVHILVKPVAPGLQTNLVIHTDRRSYHLELLSDRETYMSSLSWTYPKDDLVLLTRSDQNADPVIDEGPDMQALRFRYRIEGNAPWKPEQVFDDGRKVYIRFPEAIAQGDAPPLFVLGTNGKLALVNYRMKHTTYIVDRLFAAAELRYGEDPQQIVRIIRRDTVWK